MHPLETILGTRAKVRIFDMIIAISKPVTRGEIAKQCGGSMHGTYEQIERLIGIGVLKEVDGKIALNEKFPYLDDLQNLFLLSKGYLGELDEVLRRLDELLGDDYYIGGFLAARRGVIPMDYDTDSILVKVLVPGKREALRLKAISEASPYSLIMEEIKHMPMDVVRERTFGAKNWIASVERGIVEAFTGRDCTAYGAHLVLLQNLVDEVLDLQKLQRIASESGQWEVMAATIYSFAKKAPVELAVELVDPGSKHLNLANIKEIEKALNTVFG